ncbi:MAG: lyase-like protein [Candidatus Eremiobacteraeota bacterium]|nr:lyase-like protein [Candidatus Eremiobacteraeota bacterium]
MRLRSLVVVLGAVLVLAACGGGGGGGSSTVPTGGPSPVPTIAPPSETQGDVVAVGGAIAATPALAYDDDDHILFAVQGATVVGVGKPTPTVSLPANDSSPYITALAYSHATRSVYFSGFGTIYRSAPSGGPVTVAGSGFGHIYSIAIDPAGVPYVVDNDHVATVNNGTARALTPAGTLDPNDVGFIFAIPQLAFDTRDGALYVTAPNDTQIKRVTTSGSVSTVAGSCASYSSGGSTSCFRSMIPGAGAAARFGSPSGIAYDAANDVFYVSDSNNNVVWSVTAGGTATIIAGYGNYGWHPGNGRFAFLFDPISVAFSSAGGELYINQLDPFSGTSTVASLATAGTTPLARTFPFAEFPTATFPSQAQGLAGAPDGSAWFTEGYGGKIGHVTTAGVTEFPLINGLPPAFRVAVDSVGTAWMTNTVSSTIVRVAADGTQTAVPLPPQPSQINAQVGHITIGPDGNPWFGAHITVADSHAQGGALTSAYLNSIDRNSNTVTSYLLPLFPIGPITAGPDGNLWYYTFANNVNAVARVNTSGTAVGQPFPVSLSLGEMTLNPPDHSVWWTDYAGTIGRLDQTGTESDTRLCTACPAQSDPGRIAVAPDGTIWFPEANPADLVHRDAGGNIVRYALPWFAPSQIAVRSDGKIWIATYTGVVLLFDPAAYDAAAIPHLGAPQSLLRTTLDRRTLYAAPGRRTPPRLPAVRK